MLRDVWVYSRRLTMKWLTRYWCATSIPVVVSWASPGHFQGWSMCLSRYVSPEVQHGAVLLLGVFGLIAAGFLVWRDEHRLIGLRARIRQTHCSDSLSRGQLGTRIHVMIELSNSGRPSVATDWELFLRRRFVARASERRFQRRGCKEQIDPQATPLQEGERLFGSLLFQTGIARQQLETKRRHWCIRFRDVADHALTAIDGERTKARVLPFHWFGRGSP
jgi:hypothetical protein